MIKGAVILAVGFGLGYAKAVSDQEEVRSAALAFKQFLQDEGLKVDVERKKAADKAAGATAEPEPEPEPVEEAEVVADDETAEPGETP